MPNKKQNIKKPSPPKRRIRQVTAAHARIGDIAFIEMGRVRSRELVTKDLPSLYEYVSKCDSEFRGRVGLVATACRKGDSPRAEAVKAVELAIEIAELVRHHGLNTAKMRFLSILAKPVSLITY